METVHVAFDAQSVHLPVWKIRSKAKKAPMLEKVYDGDIAIITCSSFVGDNEEDLGKFYEVGMKCRTYRHIIWDLSNNLGGNSAFPKRFLAGLDGGFFEASAVWEVKSSLVQAKETGIIDSIPRHLKPVPSDGEGKAGCFCGALHVIINDQVASSAELAVVMAKQVQNCTFYGCNSLGIGCFGDLCIYYLPNTHIVLWCPQKVFDTGIKEEIGFEPDYWMNEEDVASAVKAYIKLRREYL